MPDALAAFCWAGPETLSTARQHALVDAIRNIPRPPAALHQLLSPQFLERANSNELADLITSEVRIAAKVLATVNSPYYGLRQPVSGIGQAVTFLGLTTVRSICLQYLLDDSFKPGNQQLKRAYDQIWAASALASELCAQLSPRLSVPDSGALVAQVLLSFLGHLATASLMPQQPGTTPPTTDLLARTRWAQDRLGLGASEIGGLLLQEWGLPTAIVDEVRGIDRLLVTPALTLPPQRSQRLAVAYLCARLGERLAQTDGTAPADLTGFDLDSETGADFFHPRAHLAVPAMARLNDHLQSTDLNRNLQTLRAAVLARH
ncbi:MAG: HDOD domain-containing protein [Aquabacterium sp.]|nr:HDOD domain-containing protein [Aquabacterium sp.]